MQKTITALRIPNTAYSPGAGYEPSVFKLTMYNTGLATSIRISGNGFRPAIRYFPTADGQLWRNVLSAAREMQVPYAARRGLS